MSEFIDYLKMLFDSGENRDSFDQKVADFFPAIIYVYDVDNKRLKFVNQKVSDFLGYSFDEVRDGDLNTLIFKDDVDLFKQELEKFYALQNSDTHSYSCRLNHKQGHWRYFRTLGSVLRRKDDGQAASLLFIAQDITDQFKGEQEIKAIRALVDETEELLQFGSWSYAINETTMTWTDGLYNLLEFSKKDLPEVTRDFYLSLIAQDDLYAYKQAVQKGLDNKTGYEVEYQITTGKQNKKIVSSKGKLVLDDDGKPVKMMGITRDVTTFRNFERDRERSIRELNRSNRELEEFAYVASHDLQEPLRKVSTFSERLRAKYSEALGDEGMLYVNRILASTENMRILIDNLLEFSRTTRSTYEYTLVDLNEIVKGVKTDLELKIEETGASLVVFPLPLIEVVPSEMKQLFNNLLSNAIKFKKPDQYPSIEISSEKVSKQEKELHHLQIGKEFFKIIIRDNGIGFEKDYAERIFQIFQRLHGKSEYPGSGIGLAICKKIVDNHNGVIYAEGEPDQGSTFVIILPEKQS
jgi:PAS domain S-box-containing protein